MSDDTQQPIVVKKIKKGGGGAHGGAWKIAYADFVTAMMAFFLLMWLLGSTSQGDLNGIAEFFQNPLKVAMGGGSGSGDSSSLIPGGGKDLTATHGQVKKGDIEAEKKTINLQRLKEDFERQEKTKLESLKGELEALINASPALSQFKNQLLLDLTTEGLRIQIVDEKNRPMFDLASSDVKPYTRVILREIGLALNKVDNRISLSGHTDAQPYAGGSKGYSNWELSADRANAARRELIAGNLVEERFRRVVGLSSAVLFDMSNPLNPVNRRISIIVMNKRTEEAVSKDGGTIEDDKKEAEVKEDETAQTAPKETQAKEEVKDAKPNAAPAKP